LRRWRSRTSPNAPCGASSVIENLNSRLRFYFFLRRHLGADYLELLRFFLNHRRFPRSERPERVGKSPAELLTGSSHPHWLEMLGYTRFSRNLSRWKDPYPSPRRGTCALLPKMQLF
jgi:hypothetical protein